MGAGAEPNAGAPKDEVVAGNADFPNAEGATLLPPENAPKPPALPAPDVEDGDVAPKPVAG